MKFGIITATLVTAGMAAPTPQLTGLSLAGDLSETAGTDTQTHSPGAVNGALSPTKPQGGLLGGLVEPVINDTPNKGSTSIPGQGKGTQRPTGTQTKGISGGGYSGQVSKDAGGMRRRRLGPEAEKTLETLMAMDPQRQEEKDIVRSALKDLEAEGGDGLETTEDEEVEGFGIAASQEDLGIEPKRRQLGPESQDMVDALMAERPQEQHQTVEELLGEPATVAAGQTETRMRRRQLSPGAKEKLEALLAEFSQEEQQGQGVLKRREVDPTSREVLNAIDSSIPLPQVPGEQRRRQVDQALIDEWLASIAGDEQGGQQTKRQLDLPTQEQIDAILNVVEQGQQGQGLETRQAESMTDEEAIEAVMAEYEQEYQEFNPKKRQIGSFSPSQLLNEFASGKGKGKGRPAAGVGNSQSAPSPKPAGQGASLPKPASQGQSSVGGTGGKNSFAAGSSKSGAADTVKPVAVAERQPSLLGMLLGNDKQDDQSNDEE